LKLSGLKCGETAKIVYIYGGNRLRRRLLDMGLTPETEVTLVKFAPLGDPIELSLRGYSLSLRKEDADSIEVEKPL